MSSPNRRSPDSATELIKRESPDNRALDASDKPSLVGDRSYETIIEAVRNPLGFFVLLVLLINSLCVAYIAYAEPDQFVQRVLAICGLVTFVVAVVNVSLMSWFRPEALLGRERRAVPVEIPELRIGSPVIVLKPLKYEVGAGRMEGAVFWSKKMQPFVGMRSHVSEVDRERNAVRLDIDRGEHLWPLEWIDWR